MMMTADVGITAILSYGVETMDSKSDFAMKNFNCNEICQNSWFQTIFGANSSAIRIYIQEF